MHWQAHANLLTARRQHCCLRAAVVVGMISNLATGFQIAQPACRCNGARSFSAMDTAASSRCIGRRTQNRPIARKQDHCLGVAVLVGISSAIAEGFENAQQACRCNGHCSMSCISTATPSPCIGRRTQKMPRGREDQVSFAS